MSGSEIHTPIHMANQPSSSESRSFYNYPVPREGPSATYKDETTPANPVLRGLPLAIGASVVIRAGFIQSYLFSNAGFGNIRGLKDLETYSPRYDPTVIPVVEGISQTVPLPTPQPRKRPEDSYTVADYHDLYLSQKLTPTMVVEALLPLIRRDTTPPGKHSTAFLQTRADLARAAAEASTERYKQGKPLGMLDGIPIAVKDEVDLKGYRKTFGSKLDYTSKLDETAWCVRKWEEAGAVIIGKTNMHEIGLDTTNNNPITGTPLNPHNNSYYTGGSSGGSGYAVSAGLVPITLGADGGGSIRIPSSFCGVYGIKPSHGRVSGRPSSELASTTGVLGPIAGSIDDLAIAYRVMAAPDPSHASSSKFPSPLDVLSAPTKIEDASKYIGIVPHWVDRAEAPVKASFDHLINHYKTKHNYTVVEIDIPYLRLGQKAHAMTILSEIRSGLNSAQLSSLTYPNQILMSVASQAHAVDFLAAMKLRGLIMQHLAHLWKKKYPGMIIATPTTPIPGWEVENPATDLSKGVSDGDKSLRNMEYVWLANFTGCPAISFPMAEAAKTGVPMGMMGMGEWGDEEALFEWAREGDGVWEDTKDVDSEKLKASGFSALRSPRLKGEGRWVDVLNSAQAPS